MHRYLREMFDKFFTKSERVDLAKRHDFITIGNDEDNGQCLQNAQSNDIQIVKHYQANEDSIEIKSMPDMANEQETCRKQNGSSESNFAGTLQNLSVSDPVKVKLKGAYRGSLGTMVSSITLKKSQPTRYVCPADEI